MTSLLVKAGAALSSAFGRGAAPSQPEWADQLVSLVEQEFTRRRQERLPWELQWRLNREFVNGNQYLEVNTAAMTLAPVQKLFWWQEREVFNHIAPILETRIARLQRTRPVLKVRPASGDPGDLNAAKVSSRVLAGTYSQLGMRAKLGDAISWMELEGTVFLAHDWDPRAGRVIFQVPAALPGGGEQAPETDLDDENLPAQAAAQFQKQPFATVHEGDVDTDIWPAHEVYPDSPWNDGIDKCRSVIHARAYHVDDIRDIWGKAVEPEEVESLNLRGTSAAVGGLGYGGATFYQATSKLKHHAIVKRWMENPSARYPLGRLIAVASHVLLYAGPLPYAVGDNEERGIPVVRVVSIHQPGCFFGKSLVERLIPVQRRYNALRNRKAEYLNRAAIGQWYKPTGSVDDDSLNNAPGQIIEYSLQGGGRPEPVQWPELPSAFETEEQSLLNELTVLSGLSELSRFSNAPPGVKTGIALSIAQEQDDTRLSTVASRIEDGLVAVGKQWLRFYKQFVQEPRLLRYIGGNNVVEVSDWTASDIRSDDVIVEGGAALAESPAQRRQMIFDLLHEGLFSDPKTGRLSAEGRNKVFELLEFGNWESGPDDEDKLQRSRAERENRQLGEGQELPVADYDDHLLHFETHNRFRLTTDHELALLGPMGFEIQMAFQAHTDAHLQALAGQVQQAQLQAGPLQGQLGAMPTQQGAMPA